MSVLGNKNDSIHQFIIEEEYARLRVKQKLAEPFSRAEEESAPTSQSPLPVVLKELFEEEAVVLREKDQLVRAKQVLIYRITEIVEKKKSRIKQLNAEILELRQECETLAKAI